MPRDFNSAWNIKLERIEMVRWGTPEPGILNMGKLNTLAKIRTSILDVNNLQQKDKSHTRRRKNDSGN